MTLRPGYDVQTNTWTTKEGKTAYMWELEDEHLKNIVSLLEQWFKYLSKVGEDFIDPDDILPPPDFEPVETAQHAVEIELARRKGRVS